MDTVSIITGLAIVAIITLTFIPHHLIKRKKEKIFLNDIISLTESENAIKTLVYYQQGFTFMKI
jgi:hypothetical protein